MKSGFACVVISGILLASTAMAQVQEPPARPWWKLKNPFQTLSPQVDTFIKLQPFVARNSGTEKLSESQTYAVVGKDPETDKEIVFPLYFTQTLTELERDEYRAGGE